MNDAAAHWTPSQAEGFFFYLTTPVPFSIFGGDQQQAVDHFSSISNLDEDHYCQAGRDIVYMAPGHWLDDCGQVINREIRFHAHRMNNAHPPKSKYIDNTDKIDYRMRCRIWGGEHASHIYRPKEYPLANHGSKQQYIEAFKVLSVAQKHEWGGFVNKIMAAIRAGAPRYTVQYLAHTEAARLGISVGTLLFVEGNMASGVILK